MRFTAILVIGVLVTLIYLPLRILFLMLFTIKSMAIMLYYMPEIATMLSEGRSKEELQTYCQKIGIL